MSTFGMAPPKSVASADEGRFSYPTPVSVPYRRPEVSSQIAREGVSDVIVRIETSTGLVGWGESFGVAAVGAVQCAIDAMVPFVVGRSPWEAAAIRGELYWQGQGLTARWIALPLINVDAQALGLDRRTAAGVNLFLDEGADQEPELQATMARLEEARPVAYLDFHSWHWGGDGCFTPGWLSVGDDLYNKILLLRHAIEQYFPMAEQIFYDEAPTNWLTRVSTQLQIPTIDPEITLCRGTDGVWKTADRAFQDGAAIVRGASAFVNG